MFFINSRGIKGDILQCQKIIKKFAEIYAHKHTYQGMYQKTGK